jgi:hypothetical protein
LLADAAAFAGVVHGGALAVNGMPVFDGLSAMDVDAIRAYVIARANADARATSSSPQ